MSITACASTENLKINLINDCLKVGNKIEIISQCITRYPEYIKRSSTKESNMYLYRIVDNCTDDYYKNCSNVNLINNISIGIRDIKDPGSGEKKGEIKVIINPYKLFYSRTDNMGGNLVMLYVFYSEIDRKVIGWINLGAIENKYNFNHKKR